MDGWMGGGVIHFRLAWHLRTFVSSSSHLMPRLLSHSPSLEPQHLSAYNKDKLHMGKGMYVCHEAIGIEPHLLDISSAPLLPSTALLAYPSYRRDTSLTASYPAVMRTMASSEKIRLPVPVTRQPRKTMQRFCVDHVKSIYGTPYSRISNRGSISGWTGGREGVAVRSCCTGRPCPACRGPCGRGPCASDP